MTNILVFITRLSLSEACVIADGLVLLYSSNVIALCELAGSLTHYCFCSSFFTALQSHATPYASLVNKVPTEWTQNSTLNMYNDPIELLLSNHLTVISKNQVIKTISDCHLTEKLI